MKEVNLMGAWVRRFLMEHLIGERNLTSNTRTSYRDTLTLLLPFAAERARKTVDSLCVEHISTDTIRLFLQHIEEQRHCTVATRNQRLAAIHALARFIGERSPEHVAWCTGVRSIPFKKTTKPSLGYLEKSEMDALLDSPDTRSRQGQRDHAMLLFLYNTGARADEAAHVTVGDLNSGRSPSVKIIGKGRKVRYCPLWASTVKELAPFTAGRILQERVFLNRRKQPITRFGIRTLVKRYALRASQKEPSLQKKRVTTHTIRHTTAVHLLRAGVDINTIRAWLGHVSLDSTHIYAEVDIEMKAKALAQCEVPASARAGRLWHANRKLMTFLRAL